MIVTLFLSAPGVRAAGEVLFSAAPLCRFYNTGKAESQVLISRLRHISARETLSDNNSKSGVSLFQGASIPVYYASLPS